MSGRRNELILYYFDFLRNKGFVMKQNEKGGDMCHFVKRPKCRTEFWASGNIFIPELLEFWSSKIGSTQDYNIFQYQVTKLLNSINKQSLE